ncbi:hypothetical protein L596_005554 [Steinernema carpocapsae]|uniref:Uncharacterized protein n=1 Tax=Steinernema carpocapsae TaxID=34508 RepID=A0A4U8UZM0_STECR|nr:hypothetical protein L596_005554 [Steinernema carpocapsae]
MSPNHQKLNTFSDEGSYPEYDGGHVYGDDIVIKSNEIVKTPIVSKEKSEEVEDKVQDDVDKLTTTTEEPRSPKTRQTTFETPMM